MMNLFNQPKPRRFEHINIYADDRKKRLKEMEKRAKAAQDTTALDAEETRKRFHDSFTADMRHLKRRKAQQYSPGGCLTANTCIIAVILLVLLAVWRILLMM